MRESKQVPPEETTRSITKPDWVKDDVVEWRVMCVSRIRNVALCIIASGVRSHLKSEVILYLIVIPVAHP